MKDGEMNTNVPASAPGNRPEITVGHAYTVLARAIPPHVVPYLEVLRNAIAEGKQAEWGLSPELREMRDEIERLREAAKGAAIIANHASAIIKKLQRALRFYAEESEWSGKPWRLQFNSGERDGHGWEVAAEALAAVQRGQGNG